MNSTSADTTKKAVVVIPFYKDVITDLEMIALKQCARILSDHDIIAIKPDWLELPGAASMVQFRNVISFNDEYFASIAGYNKLMLSAAFYETFIEYQYVLIYQLDAFAFKDELNEWCTKGYDYIGAPWIRDIGHVDRFKALKSNIKYYLHTRYDVHINGEPSKYQYENRVGNGGFSLRNVKKFAALCHQYKDKIDVYLQKGSVHYNEDRFWSIEVNRKKKVLNIPDYKTGVHFSMEYNIKRALSITNGRLPFGCHAWDKNRDSWREIFADAGYEI